MNAWVMSSTGGSGDAVGPGIVRVGAEVRELAVVVVIGSGEQTKATNVVTGSVVVAVVYEGSSLVIGLESSRSLRTTMVSFTVVSRVGLKVLTSNEQPKHSSELVEVTVFAYAVLVASKGGPNTGCTVVHVVCARPSRAPANTKDKRARVKVIMRQKLPLRRVIYARCDEGIRGIRSKEMMKDFDHLIEFLQPPQAFQ